MSSAVMASTTDPDIRFTSKFSAILERIHVLLLLPYLLRAAGFLALQKHT